MPPSGPSKLTPELQEAICKLHRLGMPIEHICDQVGIHRDTHRRWCNAGKTCEDIIYSAFTAAIKKAKAQFVSRNMSVITKAARKSWQASAWLLERRIPEEFAKKEVEQLQDLQREIADLKAILGDRAKASP